MTDFEKRFKLVILRAPFEIWDQASVNHLFSGMVALKKAGYGSNYGAGVLPVDTTDFIATHVLLCLQFNSGLVPVMGYKVTMLADTLAYNLAFPGLSLVKGASAEDHTRAMERIIERCRRQDLGLGYLGSWTVEPGFKRTSGLNTELREIFTATYGFLFRRLNTAEIVIGGTPRFHTEKVFLELGHRPLALDGRELPQIRVAHLVDEPVLVMHARHNPLVRHPSEEKWQWLWDRRLEIVPDAQPAMKVA